MLALCMIAEGKLADAEPPLKSLAHREAYFGDDHEGIEIAQPHGRALPGPEVCRSPDLSDGAVKIGRSKVGLMPATYPDSQRLRARAIRKYDDAVLLTTPPSRPRSSSCPTRRTSRPSPARSAGDFADSARSTRRPPQGGQGEEAKELEAKAESVLKPKDQ
jgi:hypothetical protein